MLNFIKKIPPAAAPFEFSLLLKALFAVYDEKKNLEDLEDKFIGLPFFYNSGASAFYAGLCALKKVSLAQEVILPAYTAGALIAAIRKAGLKPVLCDVSLDDFNLDPVSLASVVNKNTLAITAVHMFGIPLKDTLVLKSQYPDCFLIEDCAQSFASRLEGKATGSWADIVIHSFNRGKNISACGGGCLVNRLEKLDSAIRLTNDELIKSKAGFCHGLTSLVKNLALIFAIKPVVYGGLYPLISLFKDKGVANDFEVRPISKFQRSLIYELSAIFQKQADKRYDNGKKIISGLKDLSSIVLPQVSFELKPAFNRMPIIIKDPVLRDKIKLKLWQKGIEASYMYEKPLHHMFDLGYGPQEFPNAVYLAQHLLTLPVHPSVTDRDIEKMIKVIKIGTDTYFLAEK